MVYVNSAAEVLFGYSVDELLGKETRLLYADEGEYSEQGRKRYNAASKLATETYRVAYRRAGGERFLGLTTAAAMRAKTGSVVGFTGIIRPARSADNSLETLQKVHTITSDLILSDSHKIESLLRLGLRHFGLEVAILSRVVGNDYIVEHCVDCWNQLKPGERFEVSGTCCEYTLDARQTVSFCCVGKGRMRRHPCYQSMEIGSYIGSPVWVSGERYGTLNFSGHLPTEPFSRDDVILMGLLSDTVSYFLYRQIFEEEILALASTDELTGLPNRRATWERLSDLMEISNRSGFALTVLSIDVDYFKNINDQWGHAVGDMALGAFARIAVGLGRKTDFCGRVGGEEFLFVFPGATLEDGWEFGDQLRRELRVTPVDPVKGEPFTLSVSVGIARYECGESLESLLARVDAALYRAKQGGRDRICQ
ncbi:hypothetical protein HHA01_05700 [Halomonas halmophila]|uniref:diguanylate cyclase n=2 Tax=Halomonas halmophila TaxID=252 RepID=A0A4Y4EWT7_9GAMM|nr:hypothetical protein HHA01_05700 [Halomonas halmophila]